ncbi:MAG TPA: hypothetical protein VIM43_00460 [Rugosibacter sp.]
MKKQYVKQLLALSTIYFATSVAIAAGATASGTASGATSTASGEMAANSKAAVAGAVSGHESAAELVAANRLATEFETLAGSRENALSLVKGLRSSTPVSLAVSAQSGASGRLVFSPPTQPMGYGEVSRALSLTRDKFAAQGITHPTPEQLRMVLVGEANVSGAGKSAQMAGTAGTAGVLQLRSQGMGWGQIGQNLNVSPSGHLAPDAQVSTRASAVTGRKSANGEGVGVNSRTQIDADVRTGRMQGGSVGGGMGLGIGGAAGVGGGLGLGR